MDSGDLNFQNLKFGDHNFNYLDSQNLTYRDLNSSDSNYKLSGLSLRIWIFGDLNFKYLYSGDSNFEDSLRFFEDIRDSNFKNLDNVHLIFMDLNSGDSHFKNLYSAYSNFKDRNFGDSNFKFYLVSGDWNFRDLDLNLSNSFSKI